MKSFEGNIKRKKYEQWCKTGKTAISKYPELELNFSAYGRKTATSMLFRTSYPQEKPLVHFT
ncbi:MAG: hypothetical protein IPJ66_14085 [Bacteroidetes bacterium]|nr:hypothetical protein [Bacteroidota bacterium]MBL0065591.1 hypothetical protein [Bacteroidota bacterium]